jgi:hypothetical protein
VQCGDRRAGALLGGGIGLVGDGWCRWCSGDRRAGASPWEGCIGFGWRWLLLHAAVVLVVLVHLLGEGAPALVGD